MVAIGSGAQRNRTNYKLTRYACYLIVQNGDPRTKFCAAFGREDKRLLRKKRAYFYGTCC